MTDPTKTPRTPALWLALPVAALLAIPFWVSPSSAEAEATSYSSGATPEGRTIWVDVGVKGRKKKAAQRLTELHGAQAQEGFELVDVEPYLENGDLEGFWVSYVRRQ